MLYQELIKKIEAKPRVNLGFYPTPFYKLERLSKQLGVNLYIKRDDFSGRNLFGGNKTRKLEFLLADALEKQAEYVFTYGASQSNHAMQTVACCNSLGLKSVLFLLDLVRAGMKEPKANLLLDKILGTEINLVPPLEGESLFEAEERYMVLANKRLAELEAEGHRCYSVPMGGAHPIGSAGFVNGFAELYAQAQAMNLKLDYVFHANGSGGTMSGIIAGKKLLAPDCKVISVNAADHNEKDLEAVVAMANKTLAWLEIEERVTLEDCCMENNYWQPGYEQPSKAGNAAVRLLASQEGLICDTVYTGKALSGLLDYVRSGKIAPGSNVVFWHTGGATALFAEDSILGDLLD